MISYKEYRKSLDITTKEILLKLNKADYQSFSELISDLEEALSIAKKIDKEVK